MHHNYLDKFKGSAGQQGRVNSRRYTARSNSHKSLLIKLLGNLTTVRLDNPTLTRAYLQLFSTHEEVQVGCLNLKIQAFTHVSLLSCNKKENLLPSLAKFNIAGTSLLFTSTAAFRDGSTVHLIYETK